MKTAQPGTPGAVSTGHAPMPDQPEYGTSHISIVDSYGNAIAMTTTIEDAFGSRQMVKGFMLNNELTDFSFAPADAQGRPVANRVQPGKRPRSSMAPTLVFDKATNQLVMSGGSPGGALIIHFTAKTLYGVLNWGLTPQQAINLPNFGSLNGPSLLEEKRFPPATVEALRARGAEVREQVLTSGLQAITRGEAHGTPVWLGGADPRREACGDRSCAANSLVAPRNAEGETPVLPSQSLLMPLPLHPFAGCLTPLTLLPPIAACRTLRSGIHRKARSAASRSHCRRGLLRPVDALEFRDHLRAQQ